MSAPNPLTTKVGEHDPGHTGGEVHLEIAREEHGGLLYAHQAVDHWPTGAWPSLAKRYLEREIGIEAKGRLIRRYGNCGHVNTREFSVIFKRAEVDMFGGEIDRMAHQIDQSDFTHACDRTDDRQRLVFVVVGQTCDDGKTLRRSVVSSTWLPAANKKLRGFGQPSNVRLTLPIKLVEVVKQWVRSLPLNRPSIPQCQSTDQIIKRTAKVRHYFSHQKCPIAARVFDNVDPGYVEGLGLFSLEITDNSVRLALNKEVDFVFEFLKLTPTPLQAGSTVIQRMGHVSLTLEGDAKEPEGRTSDAANGQGHADPGTDAR